MAGGDTPRIQVRNVSLGSPGSGDDCLNRGSQLHVSDLQYYTEPDTTGMLGGTFAHSIGPGSRPRGQTMMIDQLHREVVEQALPPEARSCADGIVDGGDIADLNSTIEWEKFERTQTELEKNGPAFKLRLATPGNHCVKWRGTFGSPNDYLNSVMLVFRAQGEQTFNKDIVLPEHGHKSRRLSKDVLVKRKYEFFHGKKTKPKTTLNGKTDRDRYRGVDREGREIESSWLDHEKVFSDFWRKTKTGEWEAVVYLPEYPVPGSGKSKPKVKPTWIHVTAFQNGDEKLSDGRMNPHYRVEIDREKSEGVDIAFYRERLLEAFYAEILRQNPLAVFHPLEGKPRYYTEVTESSREHFAGLDRSGGRFIGQWQDRLRVFKHFWREQEDGTWEAIVYFPRGGERPEQQWIHLQATKVKEFHLASGRYYTRWKIAVDTTDESSGTSYLGSLKGHISYLQTYLIEAFYDAQTPGDRNTGFELVSHYSPFVVHNLRDSGFHRVLSDPRTKLYIHGHHHVRGYYDLMKIPYVPSISDSTEAGFNTFAEANGIARDNPLPVIGVPSVMDYRTEVMQERFWVEPGTDDVVTEFEFLGVDEEKVPGSGPEVHQAMEEVAPILFDHRRALEKVTDSQTKEAANPGTTWYKRIYLIGHLFDGLIMKQGYDGITKNDVLHMVNTKGEIAVELYLQQIELSLKEAGLTEEAEQLGKIYRKYAKDLIASYEEVWSKRYDRNGGSLDEAELQRIRDEKLEKELELNLNGATVPLWKKIRALSKIESDTQRKHLLEQVGHMLPHLYGFMAREFRDWINGYESLKRKERPDREWVSHTDLFGGDHARSLEWYGQRFERGTWAAAFGVHVQLEAQKINYEFRNKRLRESYAHQVPDRIRLVEHLGSPRKSYIDLAGEKPTLEEIQARTTSRWRNSLLHTEGGVRTLLPETPKIGEPREPWDTDTWTIGFSAGRGVSRFRTSRGQQELTGFNGGFYVGRGHLWRIVDHAYKPMIEVYGGGVAHFISQIREGDIAVAEPGERIDERSNFQGALFRQDLDLFGEAGTTIGLPTGWLGVRGFLLGGVSLHELAGGDSGGIDPSWLFGAGAALDLAGGIVSLRLYDHRWYPDGSGYDNWEQATFHGIEIDLVRLNKALKAFVK